MKLESSTWGIFYMPEKRCEAAMNIHAKGGRRLFEQLVREIAGDDTERIDDLYILTDEELLCALRLVKPSSDRVEKLLEQLVAASDYAVVHESSHR